MSNWISLKRPNGKEIVVNLDNVCSVREINRDKTAIYFSGEEDTRVTVLGNVNEVFKSKI